MFLHMWAIPFGAAALSVPFLIHWLTKPQPVRMPLSTIRFVLEIVRERRARHLLRDWLILMLRAAAIALFALTIARPRLAGSARAVEATSSSEVAKIVILDVSQSMAATTQGIQALERARPLAATHISYRPGTQANLILAAATPQAVFDRPSTNFSTLVDEVAKATPLPQRLNVQAALNQASEMLTISNGRIARRELVIVSDFQRTNWAAADFSVLPVDTVIRLESVAPIETPPNLAMTRAGAQGRVERDRPFRLEVEIANYSPTPRPVTVDIALGETRLTIQGQCSAGGRTTLFTNTSLANTGWISGTAHLAGIEDGLLADNQRSFVVQVHPQPTYLLLTRQSADTRPSSSYYLERAITSGPARGDRTAERVTRVDPLRVDRETLAAADLFVLDHPGKLSDETVQLLAALLRRGRGVLYVATEPVDATNLKRLAEATGTNLQLPVEFIALTAGQIRKNLFLSEVRRRDIPFKVFGEDVTAILSPLRFNGGLSTRRIEGTLSDDILATYSDQTACLVMTACGAGTLAVLNAELGSSSLTSSPAFVPLMGELTNHLLGRERASEAASCGESLAVYLPPSASPVAGLRIQSTATPSADAEAFGELHEEIVGVMWQSPVVGPPGVYEVKRGNETVFALASAIPADEADLVTLTSDVMTDRLAGGRNVQYHSAFDENDPHDETWNWLAVACLGCLFAEIAGLCFFRS